MCIVLGLGISFLSGCGVATEPKTMPQATESAAEETKPTDSMEAAESIEHTEAPKAADSRTALPEEQRALFQQEMLLEGEEGLWRESFTYIYDPERDWYTFTGQYEPVLTKDTFYLEEDDESAEEFRAASVYQTELSAGMDIAAPLRFEIPSGPVVYEQWREDSDWQYLDTRMYIYQDERLDVTVEIDYPEYSIYTPGLENAKEINQCIREFFFYSYGSDAEPLDPGGVMYCSIYRNCEITRRDDRYLSACIHEDNYFRGANHPNEWKSGMTIDLTTGQALTLRDVIGPDRTVEDLTGTGAFHCLQIWKDAPLSPEETEATDRQQVEEASRWVDMDSTEDFYLTPDKLGLTGSVSRYYVCMEAPYTEIGLAEWEAVNKNP